MELGALSDVELVDLARKGSAPAFAVLLHRHGPAVRATVAWDDDPTGAVISTYVAAMRQLDGLPDHVPVRTWLLELAAEQVREPEPVGDERLPDLDPDERDEIWAELDLRWPDGRVPRHVPGWAGWAALVVALVSLGVLVPYAAVTWASDSDDDTDWDVLRAEPFQDESLEREQAPELVEDDDHLDFELPTFEFPEVEEQAIEEPPPPPPPPPPAEDPAPVEEEPVEEEPIEEEPVDEEPVDEEPDDDPDDDPDDEDDDEDDAGDDAEDDAEDGGE